MTCAFAHLDGSYVLGALSVEEREEFERHLPGCPQCTQAVDELAHMPALLAGVDLPARQPEAAVSPPPSTLLASLVREARRANRRRTALTAVAASVAGAAMAVGTLTISHALDGAPSPTAVAASSAAPGRTLTTAGSGPVQADVALTTVLWGTRLDLTCTYAPEGATGTTASGISDDGEPDYALVVRTREGTVQQVGTWHPLPGRTMRLVAATAASAGDIAAVEVRTADGALVATLSG